MRTVVVTTPFTNVTVKVVDAHRAVVSAKVVIIISVYFLKLRSKLLLTRSAWRCLFSAVNSVLSTPSIKIVTVNTP